MRFSQSRFNFIIILVLIFLASSVSGCEPLRKKFIRKKKETQNTEAMPVLQPIDYPEKVVAPASILEQRYGFWQVWYGEASQDLSDGSTDKRVGYDLSQLAVQLVELQKLFSGPQQKQLLDLAARLERIRTNFRSPAGVRDTSGIVKDLRLLDKDFRKQFRPQVAKEFLTAK